jgi:hypothetical protein
MNGDLGGLHELRSGVRAADGPPMLAEHVPHGAELLRGGRPISSEGDGGETGSGKPLLGWRITKVESQDFAFWV